MTEFQTTDRGRMATKLVDAVIDHVAGVFDVPRSQENAVVAAPSEASPSPGFAPYAEDGVIATLDIPLSTFIADLALTDACDSLPPSIREAVKAHMDATYRHHLEVAASEESGADAALEGWDWDKGLPLNALDEAGFSELVSEALSNADLDFSIETLRLTAAALLNHRFRDGEISFLVKANTEFEYHQSEGELSANIGPREGRPKVDHEIVDVDFTRAADFSAPKLAALLDTVRQTFPEPAAPAPGLG